MRIAHAEVLVTRPGRNFVTLRITTEDGTVGLGDATLNGRELAVKSYLEDHLLPCLIGKDASRIEDIWQYCYKGAYWRRGPVTMTAVGAVDLALWDLKGKAAGMPVYQLLGGASRDGAMCYAHAAGETIDEVIEMCRGYMDQGYRAVRIQTAIPGLNSTYGVGRGKYFYESQDRSLPPENAWSTTKYMRFVPELFAAVRDAVGSDIHLLHDIHHRLTPIEAARVARDLEPFHLFWLEDAVPAENQAAFRQIRNHSTTPLAVGEVFNSIHDCTQLISEGLIDYIRMAPVHGGGITQLRKVAALAELHHVRTGCHGATDLSPICMAAAIHFGTWVPNFGIQEYMLQSEETLAVFQPQYSLHDGYLKPSDTPGLGIDYDEELAGQFPYEPAYLPVNRLEDGSMWNW